MPQTATACHPAAQLRGLQTALGGNALKVVLLMLALAAGTGIDKKMSTAGVQSCHSACNLLSNTRHLLEEASCMQD
jgi:hypothetical protein